MQILDFNPQERLSASDQERLKKEADRLGMTVADYVEAILKKALFGGLQLTPARGTTPPQEGGAQ